MVKLRCWLRSVLLIAIGLSWFSGAMADLSDGLVAYYPFDGNVLDESGNGNHGRVNGATLTTDRFGKTDNAYSFDGSDDCILVNDSTTLNISSSISLFAWIKNDGQHYNAEIAMIVAKHYTHSGRSYTLWDSDGDSSGHPPGVTLGLYNKRDAQFHTIGDRVNDGKWHLVVGTYNEHSGMSNVYIDGELNQTKDIGQIGLMQTSVPVSIGCYLKSADGSFLRQFFHGTIDDVRIYNRAISKSEIQQLYQMNNPPDNCWATYEKGSLHIPCIKVKGPFDDELHYEADMQYEPLSDPMTFQVTGVKPK
ncbi:hypothetical protein PN36_19635 [Candidatus Thiomargarita nelsonii]|uniref:LamG-like jellyroll fold domain-containing protein n=1 Tax=Candidatus Thiomargarita nelsonii TaxID=1003181 RepID=A0A4E0QQ00_9GAMM|nr:hypothetical protein PN36_19635 [Candidatus Thiomargarita nelsonii]